MLRILTLRQLKEQQAYEKLEPFGSRREDYRTAMIAMMLANIHRNPKKRPAPYRLEDFLLSTGEDVEPRRRTQTWQEQKQIAIAIATAFSKGKKTRR